MITICFFFLVPFSVILTRFIFHKQYFGLIKTSHALKLKSYICIFLLLFPRIEHCFVFVISLYIREYFTHMETKWIGNETNVEYKSPLTKSLIPKCTKMIELLTWISYIWPISFSHCQLWVHMFRQGQMRQLPWLSTAFAREHFFAKIIFVLL